MEFTVTLYNVLIMFFDMIPAYILIKTGKAEPAHAKTVSALLLYISFPAMIFNSFQTIEFSWNILGKIFLLDFLEITFFIIFI